jgi:hypothetical protein
MIRSLPALLVALTVLALAGPALTAAAGATTAPATADDPAFFPIMIWNACPSDPAAIARVKDCGITVAGFVAPKDLDAVHAAGMKAIVSDGRSSDYDWRNVDAAAARKKIESLVAEVGKHPAVMGYYLRDEPPAGFFPGLEKVAAVLREKAPGKWPYINLFPNYATPEQLEATDYDDYLEKFVATCKPPILSYDHYALLDNGALRPEYWTNLESMRKVALKHRVPFWNIVLSVGHFNYRPPNDADLRFQAYTTLAYGGRGLAYFTYLAPAVGNYRGAPVDQFGHETPTWDVMRNVNLQVLKLAPTINQLTSTRVYHFTQTPGCSMPPADSLVESTGHDDTAMAGEFTHADGTPYVMIVNKDVTHSFPIQLKLRQPAKSVKLVSPYSGTLVPFESEYVWLAPGQGSLLRIER